MEEMTRYRLLAFGYMAFSLFSAGLSMWYSDLATVMLFVLAVFASCNLIDATQNVDELQHRVRVLDDRVGFWKQAYTQRSPPADTAPLT